MYDSSTNQVTHNSSISRVGKLFDELNENSSTSARVETRSVSSLQEADKKKRGESSTSPRSLEQYEALTVDDQKSKVIGVNRINF